MYYGELCQAHGKEEADAFIQKGKWVKTEDSDDDECYVKKVRTEEQWFFSFSNAAQFLFFGSPTHRCTEAEQLLIKLCYHKMKYIYTVCNVCNNIHFVCNNIN